jgi:uncharacterized protein (TIGR03663 family)
MGKLSETLKTNRKVIILFFIPILLLAMVLRLLFIEARPVHHDEGVNGWFVMQIWNHGYYEYNPVNYHGPLYFYFLFFSELIFGRGIFSLRFITALISIANVVLVFMHHRFFKRVAIWAALIMAISPAMVFYGRYAIHESLLVFFELLFCYGFFLFVQDLKKTSGLVVMVIGFFGAFATKETFLIFFASWFLGSLFYFSKNSLKTINKAEPPLTKSFVFQVISAGFLATCFFYSGFFVRILDKYSYYQIHHAKKAIEYVQRLLEITGIGSMFSSFSPWMQTGTKASGHAKSFFYWLQIGLQYEFYIFPCMLAVLFLLIKGRREERTLSIIAFSLFLIYSFIPYKTPWLLISFIWPFFFVFGFALDRLLVFSKSLWLKTLLIGLSGLCLSAVFVRSINLNFFNYANHKEKYVYMHTDLAISDFIKNIGKSVKDKPELKNIKIAVLLKETWPLPWLLGDWPGKSFSNVDRYFSASFEKSADIFLIDDVDRTNFERRLTEPYLHVKGMLRDGYGTIHFYYKAKIFSHFVNGERILPVSSKPIR